MSEKNVVSRKVKETFGEKYDILKTSGGVKIIKKTGETSYSNVLYFKTIKDVKEFCYNFETMKLNLESLG